MRKVNNAHPYSTVNVICAPKVGNVHQSLWVAADAFKLLINADNLGEDGWPSAILGGQMATPMSIARNGHDRKYKVPLTSDLKLQLESFSYHYPVYVHPEDISGDLNTAENKRHQEAAVKFVQDHPTFRLGAQLHKLYDLQ